MMTLLLSSVSAGALRAALGPILDWSSSSVIMGTNADGVNLSRSLSYVILGTKLGTVDLRGSKTFVILE
jgi:hypothetical protein